MDVVQIANRLGLDVLCSQEAGFSAVSEASCNVRLRPLGWTIIVNSESADLARSIAVLVRLRLSPRQIAYAKDCPQLAGAIFVRLQRAGAEPFNVVNIYSPSSKDRADERRDLANKVMERSSAIGAPTVFIGDFNEHPEFGAWTGALARDLVQWLDPVEAQTLPTHRPQQLKGASAKGPTASKLDYVIASHAVVFKGRCQLRFPSSVSDHDLIAYAVGYQKDADTYALSAPEPPDASAINDFTDEDFAMRSPLPPQRGDFFAAIGVPSFDAEHPRRMLSDTAEKLLGRPDHSKMRLRPRAARLQRKGSASPSYDAIESVTLVQVRRLQRIHLALVAGAPIESDTETCTCRRGVNFRRILVKQ